MTNYSDLSSSPAPRSFNEVGTGRGSKKIKKVVLGMSGGVDSSVALLLLKKRGYTPIGVSLKYAVWDDPCNRCENICCSKQSFQIAKDICEKFGVEHHIVDVSADFKKEVIDYFSKELKNNRTPSPCVFCNPNLKFKKLFEFAESVGADFVATGHYARTTQPLSLRFSRRGTRKFSRSDNAAISLVRAKDKTKDQTYSLCFLPQKYLQKIIFPLGNLTKKQVYKIAKRNRGFEIFEKHRESQDFCFVSGRALPEFIKKEIGQNPGNIVDTDGKILGRHNGLHFYTIGQRKGIDLPGGPYYVVKKNIKENDLVVSKKEANVLEITLSPINLISSLDLSKPLRIRTKTRSSGKIVDATIQKISENKIKMIFKIPQKSIASGQVAVFYQKTRCLGAGVIS